MSTVTAFKVVGNRGAPGLVPPGGTAASLRRAIEVGANMLLVDVRRTRDDVLVIDRDNVRMVDDREIPIREKTLSEWQRKTAETEYPVTTLAEALAIAHTSHVGMILELREPGAETLLARAIRQSHYPISWLLVSIADPTSRTILRGLDPRIRIAHMLRAEDAGKINAKMLGGMDAQAVTWYHRLLTPAVVKLLQARNIEVYGWTVDLSEDMRRLRDECGVDGVITNFPDILAGLKRNS